MATYNKFHAFAEHVMEKVHDLANDDIRIMLVNSPAPVATNSLKADLTEIAAGNGYTAGGVAVVRPTSAQTTGTYKLVGNDMTITAAGGPIGPFRYAVMDNNTPASPLKPLISWWDYGAGGLTLNDGESILLDADPTLGLLQMV